MVHINQTRVVSALLLLLASSSIYPASDSKWPMTMQEFRDVALVVGGGMLGLYGCYKGIEWLITPSTQTLIDKAKQVYKDEKSLHRTHMNRFNSYKLSNKNMSKTTLEDISDYEYNYIDVTIEDYLKTLHVSIKKLSDQYAKLAVRLQKISINESAQFQPIIMSLMKQIEELVANYRKVHSALYNNLPYLSLAEWKKILQNRYSYGLKAIDRNNNQINHLSLNQHIQRTDCYQYYGSKYPYLNYLSSLQDKTNKLSSLLSKLPICYVELRNESQELLYQLQALETAVSTSVNYLQEHSSYEIEQLERRRRSEQMRMEQQLRDMQSELNKQKTVNIYCH